MNLKNIGVYALVVILSAACYTQKPHIQVDNTSILYDYNKKVSVKDASFIHKRSFIGKIVNVGVIGTGAYLGYAMAPFKQQVQFEKKPIDALNITSGALAGAGLILLTDLIMGNNTEKNITEKQIQSWISKANKDYYYLNGNASNFTMIDSKIQSTYEVRNLQDVKDFSTVFPNSPYTDEVIKKSLSVLSREEWPTLIALFPTKEQILQVKKQYIEGSPTYDELIAALDRYPIEMNEVDREKLYLSHIANANDLMKFRKMFPNTPYVQQALVYAFTSDNYDLIETFEVLRPIYKESIYLSSSDFEKIKYLPTVSKQRYLQALYLEGKVKEIRAFTDFYRKYDWFIYRNKEKDILSNYWRLMDSKYDNGEQVIANYKKIEGNTELKKMNISRELVAEVLDSLLTDIAKTSINIRDFEIVSAPNRDFERLKNKNDLAYQKLREVEQRQEQIYLLKGVIENYSKYNVPICIKGEISLTKEISFDSNYEDTKKSWTKKQDIGVFSDNYYGISLAHKSDIFAIEFVYQKEKVRTGKASIGYTTGLFKNEVVLGWELSECKAHSPKVTLQYEKEKVSQFLLDRQEQSLSFAREGVPNRELYDIKKDKLVSYNEIVEIQNERIRRDNELARKMSENMSSFFSGLMKSVTSDTKTMPNTNASSPKEDDQDINVRDIVIPAIKEEEFLKKLEGGLFGKTELTYKIKFSDGITITLLEVDGGTYGYMEGLFAPSSHYGFKNRGAAISTAYVHEKYGAFKANEYKNYNKY